MENIILLVHLLTALAVIGLIMLQQGKGAEMGASFGAGASQTLFGSAGTGNFFSRMTAIFAVVFFVSSVTLAVIAKQKTQVGDDFALPELEQLEIPAVDNAGAEFPSVDAGDIPSVDAIPVESDAAVEQGDMPAVPTP